MPQSPVPADKRLLERVMAITRKAGQIAQAARSSPSHVLKPDGSIVTPADKEVEVYLRGELKGLVPGSTVWGEELGHDGDSPAGLWAVDPIDGTSNYAFGSPLWGVSVALVEGDRITVGSVYLPDLFELYGAMAGGGAVCNGEPLPQIASGPIKGEELVSYSDTLIRTYPNKKWPGKMRYIGAFVVDAMWVARQRLRALIGIRGELYDIAASALICQELGAQVIYADGSSMDIRVLKTGIKIPKPYAILPAGAEPPLREATPS